MPCELTTEHTGRVSRRILRRRRGESTGGSDRVVEEFCVGGECRSERNELGDIDESTCAGF